jgi:hypothetical protein
MIKNGVDGRLVLRSVLVIYVITGTVYVIKIMPFGCSEAF